MTISNDPRPDGLTRADITAMLEDLAATRRALQDSGYRLRGAAAQLVTVSERLAAIGERTTAAIAAGLQARPADEDDVGADA